uniref:Uncharacterized protein n=1 Tax=Acrobeloides nanus TaxID=290746 RepID=A0A914ESU1_9BILA
IPWFENAFVFGYFETITSENISLGGDSIYNSIGSN